ncbi:MAG: hypothetical protein COZ46_05715 [Verrucomicrobia bacterium CG_4_10_14_3_um_filter_43_23]|nr:MAG: hypothetical protein AUJ82_03715 [Verrucomicrobia bacterium CG1_02_43_26]PIP58671.1 MAG: hypothetical protein COX01_07495 [Verrucomicrobia bacterium CG22_combo_CG10-13_8_21_14_all_43_17]PIX58072.1 MAG: hypothetical protein COZ46_05715 [Verrucomicrobia bacterium CG_4_10_14_3_um_filter_43_23]PIY61167.1 MAG: hypothetical protein COY94_06670 [Verrucomicrobia bacterium CG_4_10_14_0_8_um_filter_43_34]PJA43340.1 MAG: hypothetical protein CO175_08560 [Verrucomicrobia bacterium CG_4_9_14_3_um_fi
MNLKGFPFYINKFINKKNKDSDNSSKLSNKPKSTFDVFGKDVTVYICSFLEIKDLCKKAMRVDKEFSVAGYECLRIDSKARKVELLEINDDRVKTYCLKYCCGVKLPHFKERIFNFDQEQIFNIQDNTSSDGTGTVKSIDEGTFTQTSEMLLFMQAWEMLLKCTKAEKREIGLGFSRQVEQLLMSDAETSELKNNDLKDVLKVISYIRLMNEQGINKDSFEELEKRLSLRIAKWSPIQERKLCIHNDYSLAIKLLFENGVEDCEEIDFFEERSYFGKWAAFEAYWRIIYLERMLAKPNTAHPDQLVEYYTKKAGESEVTDLYLNLGSKFLEKGDLINAEYCARKAEKDGEQLYKYIEAAYAKKNKHRF